MRTEQSHVVVSIANEVAAAIGQPTAGQRRLLERLNHHTARLATSTFQLAVLGQFKRGKSSLLNALIGFPLLGMGVLPLTSIPTFLSGGSALRIRLTHLDGETEEKTFTDPEDIASAVAAATTEEHNPHNVKCLERVDVTVPFDGWLNDVILIDTPGIGSTNVHNTDAAHAVLSECDAALFVLSVDPPITKVEAEYLSAICRTVSRVIVVLNKVDLVDESDRNKAIEFLTGILKQRDDARVDPAIFPVSAREALAAKARGDKDALRRSGLVALEQHVRAELVDRKRIFLNAAIGQKIARILDQLHDDVVMRVQALGLPVAALEDKVRVFEEAAVEFVRERDNLHDLQSGEWKRALVRLEALCAEGEKRAHRALDECVMQLSVDATLATERAAIASTIYHMFDAELGAIAEAVGADLERAMEHHMQRYQELACQVRETAAALLNAALRPIDSDNWFQLKREPYWIDQAKIESLCSLTADGFARLLPSRMRLARQRSKIRIAARDAITRNISELRWMMRQNIDDSFRRLLSSSTEAVDASIKATHEVLDLARSHRRAESSRLRYDIENAKNCGLRLTSLRERLETFLGGNASAS